MDELDKIVYLIEKEKMVKEVRQFFVCCTFFLWRGESLTDLLTPSLSTLSWILLERGPMERCSKLFTLRVEILLH